MHEDTMHDPILTDSIVQGQFINDEQVLLKAAEEAGVIGAQQLLDNDDELKSEVSRDVLAAQVPYSILLACAATGQAHCHHFFAQ